MITVAAHILSAAVTATGLAADTTAAAAERYARLARWVAVLTRCVP